MIYDLNNAAERARATKRFEALLAARKLAEVSEVKPKRSNAQNAYLYAILGEFAMQTGNTIEWVKREYFKKWCNFDIFVRVRDDNYIGRVEELRSTADLSTSEMTTAIERFRNWASEECEIYLPSPDEEAWLQAINAEMAKNRNWL